MNLAELPKDLPVPVADGAADHLSGITLPSISLGATNGDMVDVASISGYTVIYVYPMTGRPDVPPPDGWAQIPGAMGCTAQSCAFRDHYAELSALQSKVYGLSAQSTQDQVEAKSRLHLPFELLSNDSLRLKSAISLLTFKASGMELYKRRPLMLGGTGPVDLRVSNL